MKCVGGQRDKTGETKGRIQKEKPCPLVRGMRVEKGVCKASGGNYSWGKNTPFSKKKNFLSRLCQVGGKKKEMI